MEIKVYKNEYNHDMVKCPFCSKEIYVREVTKVSPDSLRDLKRHISNQAKTEALNNFLNEGTLGHPHLDYVRDHTSREVDIQKPIKRRYDNDLKIN